MRKRLVPALIVLVLVALLVYQLIGQGQTECRVCVTFKDHRKCAVGVAPTEDRAREEGQRSACSLITAGVTEAFACPNTPPDEVSCKQR